MSLIVMFKSVLQNFCIGASPFLSRCRWLYKNSAYLYANGHKMTDIMAGQYLLACKSIVLDLVDIVWKCLSMTPFWWWAPTAQKSMVCFAACTSKLFRRIDRYLLCMIWRSRHMCLREFQSYVWLQLSDQYRGMFVWRSSYNQSNGHRNRLLRIFVLESVCRTISELALVEQPQVDLWILCHLGEYPCYCGYASNLWHLSSSKLYASFFQKFKMDK